MYGYLYKYLALNSKLSLPGIGQFTTDQVPSRIDFVNKRLYPFSPVIRFTQGSPMADKYFYQFIADGLQVDELDAIKKFNEFVIYIKEQFSSNGFVDFPGIGRLTRQFSNTYSFKPLNNIQPFLPDLHAERVVRKNAGHTIKVGEEEVNSLDVTEESSEEAQKEKNWIIHALVLALIALLAILYHYFLQ